MEFVHINVQILRQSERKKTCLATKTAFLWPFGVHNLELKQTSVACRQKKRWVCEPLACTSSAVCEAPAVHSRSQLWPAWRDCRSWCQKWHRCVITPARNTHTHTQTIGCRFLHVFQQIFGALDKNYPFERRVLTHNPTAAVSSYDKLWHYQTIFLSDGVLARLAKTHRASRLFASLPCFGHVSLFKYFVTGLLTFSFIHNTSIRVLGFMCWIMFRTPFFRCNCLIILPTGSAEY